MVFGLLFLQIETRRSYSFVDLKLFSNGTFTGATLSNFLLNGAAGTLIVALGLVQVAAGMNSLQSGLLTLGYLIAILATIRVGEKLLQRFGPRKPMMWGSIDHRRRHPAVLHDVPAHRQYIVLTVIGFTLFGIGLGFYATPSTDAALSNVPDAQVGAASGIYKMASSLGNAIGVAISAALYVAAQAMDPKIIQSWGLFIGRQDNVALRFGGAVGLLFNVFMVVIAIAAIILTVPSERRRRKKKPRPDESLRLPSATENTLRTRPARPFQGCPPLPGQRSPRSRGATAHTADTHPQEIRSFTPRQSPAPTVR